MKNQTQLIVLAVLALFFLLGILAGLWLAVQGGENNDIAITAYLVGLTEPSAAAPGFWLSLLSACALPLLCFILGLTMLGPFLIPLVMAARGLLLSFTICSCIRVFGAGSGAVVSLCLFGLPSLLTIPSLFVLAVQGSLSSLTLFVMAVSRGARVLAEPVVSKRSFLRLAACGIPLLLAVVLEVYLSPALLQLAGTWLG